MEAFLTVFFAIMAIIFIVVAVGLSFYRKNIIKTIALFLHSKYSKVYEKHLGTTDAPTNIILKGRGLLPYMIKKDIDVEKDTEMAGLLRLHHKVFISSIVAYLFFVVFFIIFFVALFVL
jgi:hypothetical protein